MWHTCLSHLVVTFISLWTCFRYEGIAGIEKKGIKMLRYQMPPDVSYFASNEAEKYLNSQIFENPNNSKSSGAAKHAQLDIKDCDYIMKDGPFMETVKSIGFDIAIVEPYIKRPCTLILPKYLGIKFVAMAGFYFLWDIRIPAMPSFYPMGVLVTYRYSLKFKDRLVSFIVYLMFELSFVVKRNANEDLLKNYPRGVSYWSQLLLEEQLFIVTNDHLLDRHLRIMPNLIRLPCMSCRPSLPLPDDLEQIMTDAKEGVIVMTFGLSVTSIPDDIVKKFLDGFSQLKQTVIAKLAVPQGWTVPKNVKIRTWLPQNNILGHPKTFHRTCWKWRTK